MKNIKFQNKGQRYRRIANTPLTLKQKVELIRNAIKYKLTHSTVMYLFDGIREKLEQREEYELLIELIKIKKKVRQREKRVLAKMEKIAYLYKLKTK